MLIARTVLNCILIGLLLGSFTGIVIGFVTRAYNYRKKHGISFKDKLSIRIINLVVTLLVVAACSVATYYADKFGSFIYSNSDMLAVTYGMSGWEILILAKVYSIAGRLVTTLSFVIYAGMLVTVICAIDSFILRPGIKIDKDNKDPDDQDKDEGWREI